MCTCQHLSEADLSHVICRNIYSITCNVSVSFIIQAGWIYWKWCKCLRSLFPSRVPFIFTHYPLLIFIIWCVLFVSAFRWFFFCVPSLKPTLFLFSPSNCCPLPHPPTSHPHIGKQPVKVKRKKSFNLSRKFPFYKSKENIVQDLVESEREYQLCDWGGVGAAVFLLSLSCFSSVFQLSSLRSPPGMVCVMAPLASLSHCPRETPHAQNQHQAGDVGVLSGVSVHLSVGSRGVSSCACCQLCTHACVCVHKFLAALTHKPSNTVMLLLRKKSWSILQSVTDPQQEESH